MRSPIVVAASIGTLVTLPGIAVFSQTPPTFDVVSIRQTVPVPPVPGGLPFGSGVEERPDGGISLTNIQITTLLARAYPALGPRETINLPDWARSERYDVRATASLTAATPNDRSAMMRAMLADRFKLAVHFEKRERDGYALVLARQDGKLGPNLTVVDVPCPADGSAPTNAPPQPTVDLKLPPPPCTSRIVGASMRDRGGDGQGQAGDLLEGIATMSNLARLLSTVMRGQPVVDKTGLAGTYRFGMNFDFNAAIMPPTLAPRPDAPTFPSVRSALEGQLGLKVESSRVLGDALVIDSLERPTEN